MRTEYFEGILQLRDVGDEVKEYIDMRMEEENVHVAKRVKQKSGSDYYVSSNKFLMKMKNELPKKFGGEIKISRKLFSRSRETSKDIYRVTLFFRQLPFKVGSIISYHGEKVKILGISGTKISARGLESGKRFFLRS